MTGPATVLLVDDNPADLDLACEVLAQRDPGPFIVRANDGAEAITFLKERSACNASLPDLMLLDLNLPRKDGRQVLLEFKRDPALAHMPVVVLTTSQSSSDVLRAYELGANCYVRKPGTLAGFVAAIRNIADFWLGHAILPKKGDS